MGARERRVGVRVDVDMFLSAYIRDRPYRTLAENLSSTGIFVNRVGLATAPAAELGRSVGLEFELPGTGELIWARAEICTQRRDGLVVAEGLRFSGMARAHARLLRDFCAERRQAQLSTLLERIRAPRQRASQRRGLPS